MNRPSDFAASTAQDSALNAVAAARRATDAEPDFARYTASWKANRGSSRLRFEPELERRYEAATCEFRMRELRLTVSLSAMFYLLTSVTDPVLVPDIGFLGLWLRTITVPVWLGLMVFGHRFSGRLREAYLATLGGLATVLVAVIAARSSAPLAPYEFTVGMLTVIYVNTTYPLRFGHALVATSVALVVTLALLAYRAAAIGPGLAATIGLLFDVACSYSLISCYRIERSQRLAFLLSSRESQRLAVVAADRDAVAARSNLDALTGLANRGHFDRRLAALVAETGRPGRGIALLMLDVDHFKRYNDHHGHPAGDAALRQVAALIDKAVRDRGDLAARYGGEEFALLLRDIDAGQAGLIAERICAAVHGAGIAHDNRDDGVGVVTVSIGTAFMVLPESGPANGPKAIEALIDAADRALYAAKHGGRNRVERAAETVRVAPERSRKNAPAGRSRGARRAS